MGKPYRRLGHIKENAFHLPLNALCSVVASFSKSIGILFSTKQTSRFMLALGKPQYDTIQVYTTPGNVNCMYQNNLWCFSNYYIHIQQLLYTHTAITIYTYSNYCMPTKVLNQPLYSRSHLPLLAPLSHTERKSQSSDPFHSVLTSHCSFERPTCTRTVLCPLWSYREETKRSKVNGGDSPSITRTQHKFWRDTWHFQVCLVCVKR